METSVKNLDFKKMKNEILIDQLVTVFPDLKKIEKDGVLTSIKLENSSFKEISLSISNNSLSLDFSKIKIIEFDMIKLYFEDRLKYEKTALYDYKDKKCLVLYFQKTFPAPAAGKFRSAMWRYGILKNVILEVEKFAKISGLTK